MVSWREPEASLELETDRQLGLEEAAWLSHSRARLTSECSECPTQTPPALPDVPIGIHEKSVSFRAQRGQLHSDSPSLPLRACSPCVSPEAVVSSSIRP